MYVGTFGVSISLIVIAIKYKRHNHIYKICLFMALLIPALLAGLRDYSIGFDLSLYGNEWFEMAVSYNSLMDYIKKATEYNIGVGYAVINYLCSRISSSAHFFYFIYALIQILILFFAIKDYDKYISIPFAFFVYYFTYYNSSLNILRQIMAILIVLFSYRFVFDKQLVKFLLCILLAVSFHTSAIVAIVIYPINWAMNSNSKIMLKGLVIGISTLLIVLYGVVLDFIDSLGIEAFSRYSHYLTDEGSGGRYIRLIFWGFFFALFYLNKKNIKKILNMNNNINLILSMMNNEKKIIPNIDLIEICLWFSLIGSVINYISGAWLIRIIYYFDIISVFSIPLITKATKITIDNREKIKNLSYIVIGLFIFIYWVIVYVIRNGAATFPYQFMKS